MLRNGYVRSQRDIRTERFILKPTPNPSQAGGGEEYYLQ